MLGIAFGAHGAWIPLKAELAQWLLRDAWAEARSGAVALKPWPWADTFPVARIEMPRLGVNQIVLAGDDGRTLAFGPGWAPASSAPGQGGHSVISGHRDTHFAWLRALRPGDVLQVEDRDASRSYRVEDARVVDSRSTRVALDVDGEQLTLVTCWPFEAWQAGGPERYVVTARRIDAPPIVAESAATPDQQLRTRATSARMRSMTSL